MDAMLSLKGAREYLLNLPQQLNGILDDEHSKGFKALLEKFDEYFNIVASVNLRSSEGTRSRASDIPG
jgi:hypothetical protein